MPTLVPQPTRIRAAGTKPKLIDEYIGRVNTTTSNVSVAHMRSPQGWEEPGQTPEFEELTIVLKGTVQVRYKGGQMEVKASQAVISHAGEWIQYSTPGPDGAQYIAVCLPARIPRPASSADGRPGGRCRSSNSASAPAFPRSGSRVGILFVA